MKVLAFRLYTNGKANGISQSLITGKLKANETTVKDGSVLFPMNGELFMKQQSKFYPLL
jgi:hypothetical protein